MQSNQEKIKLLYLVRGLPGSGKSTFSKTLGTLNFETDSYFLDDNGNYEFDPQNIKRANFFCINSVTEAMEKSLLTDSPCKYDLISVSNVFSKEKEMEPYLNLANKYGYYVFSIIIENRHGNKSLHHYPGKSIENIREGFEIQL